MFLRFLEKKYQLLTSSITEVSRQLAAEDITCVRLLELGWMDIKKRFPADIRGIIEHELQMEQIEEVPPFILARGPLALKAFNNAVSHGKTFVRRVPIMIIGQDRSGKTSLKKSLRGQPFDRNEDSTVGIDVDPSHFKVSHDIWKAGEKDQGTHSGAGFSYEHHAARLTVENLNREKVMPGKKVDEYTPDEDVILFERVTTCEGNVFPSVSLASDVPAISKGVKDSNADLHSVSSASVVPYATSHDSVSDSDDVAKNSRSIQVPEDQTGRNENTCGAIQDMPDDMASLIELLLQNKDDDKSDESVYSVLWDFGGQTVYYATHPLFLTSNAIFLLVNDLSRNPHEKAESVRKQGMFTKLEDRYCLKTNLDYLDFWMSSVASLASQDETNSVPPESDVLPGKLPPVFLVCTHADTPHDGGDPDALAKMVFGHLQTKPYKTHLYEDVFVVDNTKSGYESECPEVVRLRKKVLAVAKELPQAKQAVPIKWLKFEKAIQATKEEGHKWISLESAKQIASDVCDIVDDEEFSTLLNFLHDQRMLIHFDDTPELSKLVVLDAQGLIDVFKEVITVRPYDSREKKFKELWCKLEREGILEEALLEHVWAPLYVNEETCESLIAIMEKFCLLCAWPSSHGSTSKQYLVPSMLMSHPPEDIMELVASSPIPSLFLKFDSGQVPPGLFSRLVLQLLQWCKEECGSPADPQLYQNFARIYNSEEENCSVILLSHMSFIEVVVHRGSSSHEVAQSFKSTLTSVVDGSYDTFACAVLRQLELMLESMRREFCWLQNMKYEKHFLCPVCCKGGAVSYCRTHRSKDCKQEECLHFWSESELCSGKKIICCTKSAVAKISSVSVNCFEPWFAPVRKQLTFVENDRNIASVEGQEASISSEAQRLLLTPPYDVKDIVPQLKESLQLEHTVPENLDSDSKRADKLITPVETTATTEVSLPDNVQQSLLSPSCDAKEVVLQLKENLHLDQAALERPDPATKTIIRSLARKAKDAKRMDVFEHLREITPAGTSGPLLPENHNVLNIPVSKARQLTIDLSGGEEWKLLAEGLGLTPQEIRFLDNRTLNPLDAALAFIAKQRYVSVGEPVRPVK